LGNNRNQKARDIDRRPRTAWRPHPLVIGLVIWCVGVALCSYGVNALFSRRRRVLGGALILCAVAALVIGEGLVALMLRRLQSRESRRTTVPHLSLEIVPRCQRSLRCGFRPGAFGFPVRGDCSRDVRTISSNADLGTFTMRRISALNRRNSDVALNWSAVRLVGGGCASLVPAAFVVRPSAIGDSWNRGNLFCLADELLVGHAPSDNLLHRCNEPLGVRQFPIVEPERLLVQIPEQMERFDAHVRPLDATLQETPEVFHAVGVDLAIGRTQRGQ